MRQFLEELKETKGTAKRWRRRVRRLRTFVLWHYILLGLSTFNAMLALFAIVNTNAPWRGAMALLIVASFALGLWLLFSGLGK